MMVNFKLGDKFDKDEIINMAQVWEKKGSDSTTGNEPVTSRTPGERSIH